MSPRKRVWKHFDRRSLGSARGHLLPPVGGREVLFVEVSPAGEGPQ